MVGHTISPPFFVFFLPLLSTLRLIYVILWFPPKPGFGLDLALGSPTKGDTQLLAAYSIALNGRQLDPSQDDGRSSVRTPIWFTLRVVMAHERNAYIFSKILFLLCSFIIITRSCTMQGVGGQGAGWRAELFFSVCPKTY